MKVCFDNYYYNPGAQYFLSSIFDIVWTKTGSKLFFIKINVASIVRVFLFSTRYCIYHTYDLPTKCSRCVCYCGFANKYKIVGNVKYQGGKLLVIVWIFDDYFSTCFVDIKDHTAVFWFNFSEEKWYIFIFFCYYKM